jgi:hypothetical protein
MTFLEIATAGCAGLAMTKLGFAALPLVARNNKKISDYPFLSAISNPSFFLTVSGIFYIKD